MKFIHCVKEKKNLSNYGICTKILGASLKLNVESVETTSKETQGNKRLKLILHQHKLTAIHQRNYPLTKGENIRSITGNKIFEIDINQQRSYVEYISNF